MKISLKPIAAGLSALAYALIVASPAAFAASSPADKGTGQALEISPPLLTLSAAPGDTIKTQIDLRDVSQGKLLVTSQVNDFVAAGEDGTPKILMDNSSPSDDPFSMKAWVAPMPSLTLSPQQIVKLPVTIQVPKNASPGGHYGVVRFTATPPELKGTGVSLSASLGSLMLITVKGKTTEKLSVAGFSVSKDGKASKLFQSTPVDFVERIKNSGNIHEEPAGQVTISNMFGKKVAAVNVNMPPRNILPDSTRKFQETLDSSVIGNKKLFGLYHATLNITYGNKQTLVAKTSFWVIPYRLVGFAIVAIVGGFFLLRFLLRRYNQSIINKSQGKKPSRGRKKK